MALTREERLKRRRKANLQATVCIIIALVLVITGVCVFTNRDNNLKENTEDTKKAFFNITKEPTEPPVPTKVTEITIGSTGDVLIHEPVYNSVKNSSGEYDFTEIFQYIKPNIESYDYFVANLETTLAGNENGRRYTSYPCFNSPDSIATALKDAGVDCFLTANNHCYDTGSHGIHRTQQVISDMGFDYVGTATDQAMKRYFVEDIKGIKIGIAAFTYETTTSSDRKAINGILVDKETDDLINSFNYDRLDEFYTVLQGQLDGMKSEGADMKVVYLHWGNEYQTTENEYQHKIAQKLCDMGVDVIVGGHPHVIQPVELYTSKENPDHKMVCVYSLGNFISNQRKNIMNLSTGHTEDGMIFEMTFSKYSDGTVVFEKINVVPTWVHMHTSNGKEYNVVPLVTDLKSNSNSLGLNKSSNGVSQAESSLKRTNDIVSEGVKECNDYLQSLPRPDEVTSAA